MNAAASPRALNWTSLLLAPETQGRGSLASCCTHQ